MDRNLVDEDLPRNIASQFELFAAKLMESWITAGTVQVSSGDMKMAADFLRQVGFQVEEVAGLMVKLRSKDGRTREMTREDAILFAVRCLTGREESPVMMVTAAMLGWTLGYVLAHATRTEEGPALYVPIPSRLRRFLDS